MTSFVHPSYADAQTLAGVERATDLIVEPVVSFVRGAVRGGVTTVALVVAGIALERIHAVAQSHLIDVAAATVVASVAFGLLPGWGARRG